MLSKSSSRPSRKKTLLVVYSLHAKICLRLTKLLILRICKKKKYIFKKEKKKPNTFMKYFWKSSKGQMQAINTRFLRANFATHIHIVIDPYCDMEIFL